MCDGTEMLEAASFYDVLGWSGSAGFEHVEVITAGSNSPIVCTFGMKVIPDILFSEINIEDYDALAIPGGFDEFNFYDDAFSTTVSKLIKCFHELRKPIASICVGALPVANAGILKDKKATTYHLMGGRRRRQLAEYGVNVIDAMIVSDGNIITSTSPASAPEVALLLLEKLTGTDTANQVRELMGYKTEMKIV